MKIKLLEPKVTDIVNMAFDKDNSTELFISAKVPITLYERRALGCMPIPIAFKQDSKMAILIRPLITNLHAQIIKTYSNLDIPKDFVVCDCLFRNLSSEIITVQAGVKLAEVLFIEKSKIELYVEKEK